MGKNLDTAKSHSKFVIWRFHCKWGMIKRSLMFFIKLQLGQLAC